MGKESDGKACPKLVKLDTAFKLVNKAEMWVNNMGGSTGEVSEAEFESRPPRLGLGAKVMRHVEVAASDDPVERKLIGKLGAGKRQAYKGPEHVGATKISEPSEDFDDELDSRTSVFDRKKMTPLTTSSLPEKKRKRTRQDAG
ncbi:hypothetical protein Taro_016694 [Colocasia esculenta]|uniref:Uncharacterized protein n=1 Tax=Colocasia esculenta TaxID=4460 RepID=A0A843UEF0_COLES|nr:hypothetical protein [Colocasia esculenta]